MSPPVDSNPADATEVSERKTPAVLNQDPAEAPSDPTGSKSISKHQSNLAADLTGGKSAGGRSLFDEALVSVRAESEGGGRTETPRDKDFDHLVDDPLEQEQRTDLETPNGFKPGSKVPGLPDLQGQDPVSTERLPNGDLERTFQKDGVTYTRTRGSDGSVNTSYEVDGVYYSSTNKDDGTSEFNISQSDDEANHNRQILTDENGNLISDTLSSGSSAYDGESGAFTTQNRTETLDGEGVRTINETVRRPDGGESEYEQVVQRNKREKEVYEYTGDQGSLKRTTRSAKDGTSETRTETSYTTDVPLENLVEAPDVPDHADNIVPLPQDERGPTSVRKVEVTTTEGNGPEELQYYEQSYSQTSTDVELRGSSDPDKQNFQSDTFLPGTTPNNDDSSLTRTVTKVGSLGEDGKWETSSGASQTLSLEGQLDEDYANRKVNVTRTDSWNSRGESSANFSTQGIPESLLFGYSDGVEGSTGLLSATVGGKRASAGYPGRFQSISKEYNDNGKAQDFLGLDDSAPLDVNRTVSFDTEGKIKNETTEYKSLDSSGDGRSVVRSDSGGAVGWTYTDYDNAGRDYKRQTVFEGLDVSVYEEHTQTGPGEFESRSETREGDEIVASSSASRKSVSEAELSDYLSSGNLSLAQLERMRQDGPPYYIERLEEDAEPLTDDGKLRENEHGEPIQPGHHIDSITFSNDEGYQVSKQSREDLNPDGKAESVSTLASVTDPTTNPPLMGHLLKQDVDPDTGAHTTTESGEIMVGNDGTVNYDGEELGEFNFGGSELGAVLGTDPSLSGLDLINAVGHASSVGEQIEVPGGGRFKLTGDMGALSRLTKSTDIFGVVNGAVGLFGGARDGDARGVLEGVGDITGGLNSLAAATAALPGGSKLSTTAGKFATLSEGSRFLGKALGGVGGAISLGYGLYDVFTADSGYDKAAGGLNAAAGAVALGSLPFGPPGWVVGGIAAGGLGLASIFVGGLDDNDTADLDPRLIA